MPKRTVNTTRRTTKAANVVTDAAPVENVAAPIADDTPAPYEPAPDAAPDAAPELPANVRDTSMLEAVNAAIEAAPAADDTPAPDAAPAAVAAPAKPDLKAEFIERKAAAILSVLPLYDGESLAVHRSDKIPAAQAYLDRVASPVQKAKSATARDDSALLSYYDHLTTYHAGDYLAGFNPDRFGADLGALSRNASLNRVTLSDDKQHIVLTALGVSQARNLVAARNKRG